MHQLSYSLSAPLFGSLYQGLHLQYGRGLIMRLINLSPDVVAFGFDCQCESVNQSGPCMVATHQNKGDDQVTVELCL